MRADRVSESTEKFIFFSSLAEGGKSCEFFCVYTPRRCCESGTYPEEYAYSNSISAVSGFRTGIMRRRLWITQPNARARTSTFPASLRVAPSRFVVVAAARRVLCVCRARHDSGRERKERAMVVVVIRRSLAHILSRRPQSRRDYPLNLSILLSGGKETNQDFLISGERTGKSPAPNPAVPPQGNVVFGRVR